MRYEVSGIRCQVSGMRCGVYSFASGGVVTTVSYVTAIKEGLGYYFLAAGFGRLFICGSFTNTKVMIDQVMC